MNELKFEVMQTAGTISADFERTKTQLSAIMEEHKGVVYTEDTKNDAKKALADLRKFKKNVSDRDRQIKKAWMEPYDLFHEKVKELTAIIDEPITCIDGQVKAFEEKRVQEKRADIKKAYEEIVPDSLADYLPLECIYGSKWDNAGTTMKSIRQEIKDAVAKTESEISVISSMNSDKVQDALNLYMSNRNLAGAVKYINDYETRKAEILAKQKAQEESRAESLRQEEIERIRREERERIAKEERIKSEAKKEAVEELKTVDEEAAAPLKTADSKRVIYTVVATDDELQEIEMALTSLGVYFERKDV